MYGNYGRNNHNRSTNQYSCITNTFQDTVVQMKFASVQGQDYLAAGSFDGQVALFSVSAQSTGKPDFKQALTCNLQDPVIGIEWEPTGSSLFASCCNGQVSSVNLQTGQAQAIAKHQTGCCAVSYDPNSGLLFSAGWDGNILVSDLRSPQPIATKNVGFKIFKMDMTSPLLVCIGSENKICYFNTNMIYQRFEPVATFYSPFTYQLKSVKTFLRENRYGYAIGSIEGRAAIKFVDLNQTPQIDYNGMMSSPYLLN